MIHEYHLSDWYQEIRNRNLRIRAYHDLGVPVTGGFKIWEDPRGPYWAEPEAKLEIGCEVCPRQNQPWSWKWYQWDGRNGVLYSSRLEQSAIAHYFQKHGCRHLDRLAADWDPPELRTLIELLLLEEPTRAKRG